MYWFDSLTSYSEPRLTITQIPNYSVKIRSIWFDWPPLYYWQRLCWNLECVSGGRENCGVKWTMFSSCKQITNNWHLNLQLNNLLWWHFPCLPHRHQLLLIFDEKLHFPAWKRGGFCCKTENISANEFHSRSGSCSSTLHFAQTPAVLHLWTNRSLEETGPQAGWTARGRSRL